MSLFIRDPSTARNNNSLLNNPFFYDWRNEWFNHPLISFPSIYPYYYPENPGNPENTLENKISKVFDSDVFKSVDFRPNINLGENEENYYIHVDLPGMTKDQIKMEISDEDRILTISVERETVVDHSNDENKGKEKENEKEKEEENANENKEAKKENNNKKYSRIECSYGKFERSFSIPENADIHSIHAKMENGVLEVTLNKIESAKKEQKRSIQIQ